MNADNNHIWYGWWWREGDSDDGEDDYNITLTQKKEKKQGQTLHIDAMHQKSLLVAY